MFAVTVVGLPAGLIFVGLRLEAMLGGPGERWLSISPHRVLLMAAVSTVVAGWLAAWSFAQPNADFSFQFLCASAGAAGGGSESGTDLDFASVKFLANLFVTFTYSMVGWYLADTQVRRRLASGAWSLSGVALACVFFTCALMHFIEATSRGSGWSLFFDLIGIPASIYFLWIVRQVHNDSVMDWNRRPLVGAAAVPARPSPWSGAARQH